MHGDGKPEFGSAILDFGLAGKAGGNGELRMTSCALWVANA